MGGLVPTMMAGSQEAKYELCMEYRRSMGLPTRACMEPTSGVAMKQSLRLVREVSLSMSWKMESVPGKSREDMGKSNTTAVVLDMKILN